MAHPISEEKMILIFVDFLKEKKRHNENNKGKRLGRKACLTESRIFHYLSTTLFDGSQLVICGRIALLYKLSQTLDRVALLANSRHFISSTIRCSRVRHRVAVVTIGVHFDHKRSIGSEAVLLGGLHGLLHSKDVHAVNLYMTRQEYARQIEA